MTSIEELLRDAARDFEPELKRRLTGLLGGIFRNYLPQAWEFRTESETVGLHVDKDGHVSVVVGPVGHPDLTIEMAHDALAAALKRRGPARTPPEGLKVTSHTAKGKAAFDYLRGRIGL